MKCLSNRSTLNVPQIDKTFSPFQMLEAARPRNLYSIGLAKILASVMLAASTFILSPPLQSNEFELSAQLYRRIESTYGIAARRRVERWRRLVSQSSEEIEQLKLEAVNRFFNELNFVSDIDHWGDLDYWATPLEFLGTNGGDCEDFSVAKYFTLKELGIPDHKLALTYVKSLKLNQAHMVVTYFPDAQQEPLVLDNLVPQIKSASLRKDLIPIYSFSGDGLWVAKQRGRGRFLGKAERSGKWKSITNRIARNELRPANRRTERTATHR